MVGYDTSQKCPLVSRDLQVTQIQAQSSLNDAHPAHFLFLLGPSLLPLPLSPPPLSLLLCGLFSELFYSLRLHTSLTWLPAPTLVQGTSHVNPELFLPLFPLIDKCMTTVCLPHPFLAKSSFPPVYSLSLCHLSPGVAFNSPHFHSG